MVMLTSPIAGSSSYTPAVLACWDHLSAGPLPVSSAFWLHGRHETRENALGFGTIGARSTIGFLRMARGCLSPARRAGMAEITQGRIVIQRPRKRNPALSLRMQTFPK